MLPSFELNGNPEVCFKKYIDSLLDLLLPDPEVRHIYNTHSHIRTSGDTLAHEARDFGSIC